MSISGCVNNIYTPRCNSHKLIHRPEEGLDLKSECIIMVSAMMHLPQEWTLVHQQAWENSAKWAKNKRSPCLLVHFPFEYQATNRLLLAAFEEYEDSGTTQKKDVKTPLRTLKAALNLLCVIRKYARILQQFMEIEWLPSLGFLILSLLFWQLVSSFCRGQYG